MGSQDTEITLGTGRILAIFFTLVAICAVFFGLGFTLGRNSYRPSLSTDPSVGTPVAAVRPAPSKSSPSATSSQEGLTFYKTVGQKDPATELNTTTKATSTPAPEAQASPASEKQPAQPQASDSMVAPASGSYFVQVAAVSKQEDALALIDALKKKQYSAFTSNSAGDRLYHVQIGPFSDIKDAEITRGKLVSDGYNPILKK
jgi:cell division septation protein DedD